MLATADYDIQCYIGNPGSIAPELFEVPKNIQGVF